MATLEQIQARLKKLQAQAEAILAKRAQVAVDQIRALMLKHDLTTADIDAHAGTTKARAKLGPERGAKRAGKTTGTALEKKAAPQTKGKLPPKYINHKTGETWSGHARPPAWISNVKNRSKFLIAGGAEATVPTTAGTARSAKTRSRHKVSKAVGAT